MVELAISLTVSVLLIGSLMSIAVETSRFVRETDVEVSVRLEGDRAFARLAGILRKSGRVDDALGTFPRVVSEGSVLEFRVLHDADGNGYAFDEDTGDLEWAPWILRLRRDEADHLILERDGATLLNLGRHVDSLAVRTVEEDPTLHLAEVRVTFEIRRPTGLGFDRVHTVEGSVLMRN